MKNLFPNPIEVKVLHDDKNKEKAIIFYSNHGKTSKRNSEQIDIYHFSLDGFSDICGDVDGIMSVPPIAYVLWALSWLL